jgi:hypothetical protein
MDKKKELIQMRDNLSSVQKILLEKEIFLQETNTYLADVVPESHYMKIMLPHSS